MSSRKTVDYIIIGQGLAGSCLALELSKRHKKIIVYDQTADNRCTSVAAGLFNPITGKMLAKSWWAEILFPYFHSFYRDAERTLGRRFFFPAPIYRPFISAEEQNEWMGRSSVGALREYIESIHLKSAFGEEVNDPFGGVLLKQGGYLDCGIFSTAVRDYLIESASYRNEKFLETDLVDEEGLITYHDLSAEKIIYCRGVHDLSDGCFSWLPIKPLKGETLSVTLPVLERIYNRSVYVVPGAASGTYTVGATYDFDLTPAPTVEGRASLEEKLRELIRLPFEVTGQNWGIRPTTPDRRALLGTHPKYANRVIFNGFGTKGVILAPYFSGHLADWLEGHIEITPGVNIRRFKSLYSRFEA